jgi:hypothetical protein
MRPCSIPKRACRELTLLLDRVEIAIGHARRVQRWVRLIALCDVVATSGGPRPVRALASQFRSELRADDTVACRRPHVRRRLQRHRQAMKWE